ncbi:uncharacterized protein LOC135221070 isoform X2 [Macrobrachium nipponense]|uniref:uncharacterized protein LOC135221070 isoform X2 n=1 Tax=Macrobrachium nipponense TaxID=159736 RepID=UPI0030C86E89
MEEHLTGHRPTLIEPCMIKVGCHLQDLTAVRRMDTRNNSKLSDGYDRLSRGLPTLLPDDFSSTSELSEIHPGTRLQIMNGVIPYVPCQIREYSSDDLRRCCVSRKHSGSSTWVAFVGDSSMRLKVHEFLSVLPTGLNYTYFLGDKAVTRESFVEALVLHKYRPSTFDVIGWNPLAGETAHSRRLNASMPKNPTVQGEEEEERIGAVEYSDADISEDQAPHGTYQFRLSLVWAPDGSERAHYYRRGNKVRKILEWTDAEPVPDIVVVGYGKWPLLLREYEDELVPFTELDHFSRPLVDVVRKLSAKTLVLLWSQSRYRWFNFESKKYSPGKDGLKDYWTTILHVNQFSHAMPLIDAWLWTIFRGAGVWRWDSTLPFNLANLRECKVLNDLGFDNSSIYHGRWWACTDIHHSAYETSHIEIQMMLNYLCNSFIDPGKGYCCSE